MYALLPTPQVCLKYNTAQMQVDACNLKTCEHEVTFYKKITFEF